MKKSCDHNSSKFDKNNEIFSDAINVSWDILRNNNFLINTSDDERVYRRSVSIGIEIYEEIKKIREKFMNESISVDDKKKSVPLNKQQNKTDINGSSKFDIIQSNDHVPNDTACSIKENKVEKYSAIDKNKSGIKNVGLKIDHNNDNKKLINNLNNNKNNNSNLTSATTGEVKVNVNNNDHSLPKEPNKQAYSVTTSTSIKTDKQSSVQLSGSRPTANENCKPVVKTSGGVKVNVNNNDHNLPKEPYKQSSCSVETLTSINTGKQPSVQLSGSRPTSANENCRPVVKTFGGAKINVNNNDHNLPKEPYKKSCSVETLTSIKTGKQPSVQLSGSKPTSANENCKPVVKTSGSYNSSQYCSNQHSQTKSLQTANKNEYNFKTQKIYRKLRCILNKLTLGNINKVFYQISGLGIDSPERLQGLVDLIYQKAINEPNFALLYAIMCKKIAGLRMNIIQHNVKKQQEYYKKTFQILLLKRCQDEFESITIDETSRAAKLEEIEKCNDLEKKKKLKALLEDADRRLRIKSVGNTCFMGELWNQTMARTDNLHICIKHFLKTLNDNNIKCLCELLTIIGPNRSHYNHNQFNGYFLTITELIKYKTGDKKISPRSRFMLQDVIDSRARNWKQKNDEDPSGKKVSIEDQIKTELINILYNYKIFTKSYEFFNVDIDQLKKKLSNPTYKSYFICESLNIILDKSSIERIYYSELLAHMIINNIIPLSLFQSEFDKLLELNKELVIDIPKFWTYLAEILVTLVIREAHPLNGLIRTTSVLKNIGLVGKLVGELFKLLTEYVGPKLLADNLNASGIKWTDLVDTSLENPHDIVKKYNLKLITDDS